MVNARHLSTRKMPSPSTQHCCGGKPDASRAQGDAKLTPRCAGILRPGAKPDTYPWHTLDYTSVMRVRSVLLDEGYAVATVNMALSALKSVAGAAFSMGILDADRLDAHTFSQACHWQCHPLGQGVGQDRNSGHAGGGRKG